MGKSKHFKKLRRMAQALPDVNTKRFVGSDVYGRDLIAKGILSLKGKDGKIEDVDPDKLYVQRTKVVEPMSHEKNMKRNFYDNGMKGVEAYETKVKNYLAAPSLKKTADHE